MVETALLGCVPGREIAQLGHVRADRRLRCLPLLQQFLITGNDIAPLIAFQPGHVPGGLLDLLEHLLRMPHPARRLKKAVREIVRNAGRQQHNGQRRHEPRRYNGVQPPRQPALPNRERQQRAPQQQKRQRRVNRQSRVIPRGRVEQDLRHASRHRQRSHHRQSRAQSGKNRQPQPVGNALRRRQQRAPYQHEAERRDRRHSPRLQRPDRIRSLAEKPLIDPRIPPEKIFPQRHRPQRNHRRGDCRDQTAHPGCRFFPG